MRYPLLVTALILACIVSGTGPWSSAHAEAAPPYLYVSPRPGAVLVSPRTTIAFRGGDLIDRGSLSERLFRVEGSASGVHAGQGVLADDGKTVIFKPYKPFESGERVSVTINRGLVTVSHRVLPGFQFDFTTWPDQPGDVPDPAELDLPFARTASVDVAWPPLALAPDRPTALPPSFPAVDVTVPATSTEAGYIFLSNLSDYYSYLLMLDPTSGEPVYYQQMVPSRKMLDFKRQPNGLLTYFDSLYGVFYGMDSTYTIVRTYQAGNGYRADHHDFQVLPNGHYLVLIWDVRLMDMSVVVPGGNPKAYVIGLVVQELDSSDLVVFEWRSWDHIEFTETLEDLTAQRINYVHGNAVEQDYDGNILISARNLDQIIKVDRQTGDTIWRLGGKKNEFTLLDDNQFFHRQHDIRRMPNGNITLFDNRTDVTPYYSRAVEYILDETAKTAKRVWEYRNTPDVYTPWLGNAQRLPSGNTFIGWGLEAPVATEARPDGTKEFEFSFVASGEGSYRVFRFPWVGRPAWPPTLDVEESGGRSVLSFSWNGATEIGSYRVLGGGMREPNTLIAVKERTGFETTFDVTEASYCFFRVMPLDRKGQETVYSNTVIAPSCLAHTSYMPLMTAR